MEPFRGNLHRLWDLSLAELEDIQRLKGCYQEAVAATQEGGIPTKEHNHLTELGVAAISHRLNQQGEPANEERQFSQFRNLG